MKQIKFIREVDEFCKTLDLTKVYTVERINEKTYKHTYDWMLFPNIDDGDYTLRIEIDLNNDDQITFINVVIDRSMEKIIKKELVKIEQKHKMYHHCCTTLKTLKYEHKSLSIDDKALIVDKNDDMYLHEVTVSKVGLKFYYIKENNKAYSKKQLFKIPSSIEELFTSDNKFIRFPKYQSEDCKDSADTLDIRSKGLEHLIYKYTTAELCEMEREEQENNMALYSYNKHHLLSDSALKFLKKRKNTRTVKTLLHNHNLDTRCLIGEEISHSFKEYDLENIEHVTTLRKYVDDYYNAVEHTKYHSDMCFEPERLETNINEYKKFTELLFSNPKEALQDYFNELSYISDRLGDTRYITYMEQTTLVKMFLKNKIIKLLDNGRNRVKYHEIKDEKRK